MLLIGPPRSGKTTLVLSGLERALRADRSDQVQLLVPTASMKHHLLSVLARRGLMVPSRLISTMSELVRDTTPDVTQADGAVADRLLRDAIERSASNELGMRSGSPGLRNRIAAAMSEFWAAGADSFQLEAAIRTRQQRGFLEVFLAYEESLRRAGFVHHNQRIALAAARIRQEGLGRVRKVYVDGFDRFTKQQEELLEALAEQAEEILVAMPAGLPRYPLRASAVESLPPREPAGLVVKTMQAASPRAEILEIARRILASKRPLRDHGIILRSPEQYGHLIREVFETLRIPHRSWDARRLADHGVARHFVRWLRVIDRQFPAAQAIEAIGSPLTPAGAEPEVDAYDFEVRKRLPNSGLDFLRRAAARYGGPKHFLEGLRPAQDLHRKRCGAKRWAMECLGLLPRVQALRLPAVGTSFRRTSEWRAAIQAQRALRKAIEDTAKLPEFQVRRQLSLGDFADALEDVLRYTSLNEPGQPDGVVHVLPVLESRQWSLPVAFVCGLAEGWFPRRFSEDALFDDEDRRQMKRRGIELRTTADRVREERYLFRVSATRATEQLVLSYPAHDGTGKPVMRSHLLDSAPDARQAPWATLGDRETAEAPVASPALPPELLTVVKECNEGFSASGIANFRQCPYLYFGGNTLGLRGRPQLPEHRLDGAALGSIVHTALLRWNREKRSIGAILDESFGAALKDLHLPQSFRTEQLRRALRADLVRFAHEQGASMGVSERGRAYFENDREYRIEELASRPIVRCRIDRYDIDDVQRCYVTDYKYARPGRVRELLQQHLKGEQLQLLIYLAALEQQLHCEPSGMALCGLRGETSCAGVSVGDAGGRETLTEDEMSRLLNIARTETAEAVGEILDGSIAVRPRDPGYCGRLCEFGSVCRVNWPTSAVPDKPREDSAS